MPNRFQRSAATSCQVIQEVIPNNSPRGASRQDRRIDVIPDPRETGSGFPACGSAGSCFFRVEREESPYKAEARRLKKREKEEDGRTNERAGERTNERRQQQKLQRRKKRRKKRHATVGGVRFSALVLFAVLPVSSLFPPAIGRFRNGRIKER